MVLGFTRDNYLKQISKFNSQSWFTLNESEKEPLLQWLVDYKAHQLGLPSLCQVKLSDFKDGKVRGKFDRKTHILHMSNDLVIKSITPSVGVGAMRHNPLSHKETYETLMHEFWHAVQQYVIENPGKYTVEHADMLLMNIENSTNKKLRNQFIVTRNKDAILSNSSYLLYAIQPVERYAFMYAENETKLFNDDMHMMYPNDLAFIRYYPFSNFEKIINDAKITFNTQTPFDDVDNVIRYINGEIQKSNVNQLMLQVVEKTQKKPLINIEINDILKYEMLTNDDVPDNKYFDDEERYEEVNIERF